MRKFIVIFLVFLMLCGCSNAQPISPAPNMDCTDKTASNLRISDDEITEEVTSATVDEAEEDTTEIANSECLIEERIEPSSTETATQTDTIIPTESIQSESGVPSIQQEKQEESIPDMAPQSDEIPAESQQIIVKDTPQEIEPIAPKSIYDYEFDAASIRQDLLSIGVGMGLEVDSSLTPNNASWTNPITASQSFQGPNLERSLKDYVRSMPSLIAAYGGESIHYFSIYVESFGDGSYRFYFLY